MKDINRIPINRRQALPTILQQSDIKYVDTPNTGGVPNGYRDITHPSVIYFPDGWNGYTHWMVATPYPQNAPLGGNYYENPCLYFANSDAENKHPLVFQALNTNPLVDTPSNGNHSDPDIFFAEDRLWIACRVHTDDRPSYQIFLINSSNGVDWSDPVEIYAGDADNDGGELCPMYTFENGKHRIYLIQAYRNYTEGKTDDRTRTDRITFIESSSLSEPNFTLKGYGAVEGLPNAWHGSVFFHNGVKYLLGAGIHEGLSGTPCFVLAREIEGTEDFKFYNTPISSENGAYRAHGFIDDEGVLVSYSSIHNGQLLTELTPHSAENTAGNFISKFEISMDELVRRLESYEIKSV